MVQTKLHQSTWFQFGLLAILRSQRFPLCDWTWCGEHGCVTCFLASSPVLKSSAGRRLLISTLLQWLAQNWGLCWLSILQHWCKLLQSSRWLVDGFLIFSFIRPYSTKMSHSCWYTSMFWFTSIQQSLARSQPIFSTAKWTGTASCSEALRVTHAILAFGSAGLTNVNAKRTAHGVWIHQLASVSKRNCKAWGEFS